MAYLPSPPMITPFPSPFSGMYPQPIGISMAASSPQKSVQ